MRTFLTGAEWHVHEVRYLWQHDGVFVSLTDRRDGALMQGARAQGAAKGRPLFYFFLAMPIINLV